MWDWFYNWFIPICVTGFVGILTVAVVVSLVYILYEKATCYVDDLKYQKERGRNITYWWERKVNAESDEKKVEENDKEKDN